MNARMWLKPRVVAATLLAGAVMFPGISRQADAEDLELVEAPVSPRVEPAVAAMAESYDPLLIPPPMEQLPENVTLAQAMAIALQRNPEILRAIAEIERTEGVILEVQAQALPQLMINSSYSQQDEGLNEFGGGALSGGSPSSGQEQAPSVDEGQSPQQGQNPQQGQDDSQAAGQEQAQQADGGAMGGIGGGTENWRVAVEVSQLVYSGGRVLAARRAAVLASSNTVLELQETINSVLTQVVREFYQVILDRELLRVEQENVDVLQRQLDEAQIRREAEVVADFNVLRARVELANAQPSLIRARNALELDKLRLARTIGLNPDPIVMRRGLLNPVGEFPDPEPLPDLEASLATAFRERPRFLSAIQSIQLREAQERVAFSGYLPELSVSGGYEFRNSSLSDDLGDTVDGWFLGVNGRWAIFDGFRTRGRVKQARAEIKQAELNFLSTRREIELSVEDAWFQLKTAREVVDTQQLAVEQAAEALRLSRARLDAGTGTQLEVLDTRVAWLRSNLTLYQTLYEYRVALAEFRRVTGQISQIHLALVQRQGLPTAASKTVVPAESLSND